MLTADISEEGLYTGYHLSETNNVFEIRYKSAYEKRMERLYQLTEKHHLPIPIIEHDLLLSLVSFAKENRLMITVTDLDCIGYVADFDEQNLTLQWYTLDGESNGFCEIDVSKITEIDCDTHMERIVKRLAEQ